LGSIINKKQMAKFEISKSRSGFSFNLVGPNGKTIISSEGYSTKLGAQIGIASVKKNARKEANYVTGKSRNGEHYFVLKSRNGRVIGKSETYKTEASLKTGIAAVKKSAGTAASVDRK
jgi:uncharacterized protein YegP (UPF0339 family)